MGDAYCLLCVQVPLASATGIIVIDLVRSVGHNNSRKLKPKGPIPFLPVRQPLFSRAVLSSLVSAKS